MVTKVRMRALDSAQIFTKVDLVDHSRSADKGYPPPSIAEPQARRTSLINRLSNRVSSIIPFVQPHRTDTIDPYGNQSYAAREHGTLVIEPSRPYSHA